MAGFFALPGLNTWAQMPTSNGFTLPDGSVVTPKPGPTPMPQEGEMISVSPEVLDAAVPPVPAPPPKVPGAPKLPLKGVSVSQKVSIPRGDKPQDPLEAEMERLFKSSIEEQQAQVARSKQALNNVGERPTGFQALDLSPLAALSDSWSGGKLSQGYKAPTVQQEHDQKKALLEAALAKNQGQLTDDQLKYLQLKSNEKKADEAAELRKYMFGMRQDAQGSGKLNKAEDDLRKQYLSHPLYKGMAEINDAYMGVESNPGLTGADQQALVYQFTKILDKGSVVRESEYAMSAKNAGAISQARQYLEKLQSGKSLTPEQIGHMKSVARNLVESSRRQLNNHNALYSELARRKGVDPTMVVVDPFHGTENKLLKSTPGKDVSSTTKEWNGKTYKLIGDNWVAQ